MVMVLPYIAVRAHSNLFDLVLPWSALVPWLLPAIFRLTRIIHGKSMNNDDE